MSRTTDSLIKALDSPSALTPAERAFCGPGGPRDLHAEAQAGGHPCDCRACAPGLYGPSDADRLDWLAAHAPRIVPAGGSVRLKLWWGSVSAPTLRGAIDRAMKICPEAPR